MDKLWGKNVPMLVCFTQKCWFVLIHCRVKYNDLLG